MRFPWGLLMVGTLLSLSSCGARTGLTIPDPEGGGNECCRGELDRPAQTALSFSGIAIAATDLPDSLRDCGPNQEKILNVSFEGTMVMCHGIFIFPILHVTLTMDPANCPGGHSRPPVLVTFRDVRHTITVNDWHERVRCVTSSRTEYGSRFSTSDTGFANLFATAAGPQLLGAILDPYTLGIRVVGDNEPRDAGPTSCDNAIFAPPPPSVPATRRSPPRC